MKTIILAAGFSTRLYPITKNFPKALLKVGNKSVIDFVTDEIVSNKEIDEICLVTNHGFYHFFEKWKKQNYPDVKIKLIDNGVNLPDKRLGAIGDLNFVLEKTKWSDDLLVVASDTLGSLKIKDFIAFFNKNRGVATIIFKAKDKSEITGRLGCATISGDKLIGFTEKPLQPESLFTGVPYYIFPKESLGLIQEYTKLAKNLDSPGSILSWLIGKIPIYAYRIKEGYYFDVGTIVTYNKVRNSKF